jgi:ABC-2 type transport system permease protein
MRAYLTLLRRELGSYFVSFTGYIIIAMALLNMGLSLAIIIGATKGTPLPMSLSELFFITPFFWIIQLLTAPIITMRLFALEKSTGTFETLMTAPVSDLQVVLAKFSASLLFYLVMWLPFLGSLIFLRRYASDAGVIGVGVMASTYLGIFLLGCLFLSFGCLASAMTRNQIVASMTTFTFVMGLFIVSSLSERLAAPGGWMGTTVRLVSLVDHVQEFSRGIVDSRWVVFYLTGTVLFLFFTHRVVESRRWK